MLSVAKQGRPKSKEINQDARIHPVVVHLSEAEKDAVKAAAGSEERSVSFWIRKAIQEKLEAGDE